LFMFFFFSSRRRHTRFSRDWSSDVCSSDLCTHNNVNPLLRAKLRDSSKGHGYEKEDESRAEHRFEVFAQRSNAFHLWFWESFAEEQVEVDNSRDHGYPHLSFPSKP